MPVKPRTHVNYTTAQRIAKLRRAQALIDAGASIAAAATKVGVKYATLYQWRRRYAGLTVSNADRMRQLELENRRLRRALLDLDTQAATTAAAVTPGRRMRRARR